jgi:hypothetical protein
MVALEPISFICEFIFRRIPLYNSYLAYIALVKCFFFSDPGKTIKMPSSPLVGLGEVTLDGIFKSRMCINCR